MDVRAKEVEDIYGPRYGPAGGSLLRDGGFFIHNHDVGELITRLAGAGVEIEIGNSEKQVRWVVGEKIRVSRIPLEVSHRECDDLIEYVLRGRNEDNYASVAITLRGCRAFNGESYPTEVGASEDYVLRSTIVAQGQDGQALTGLVEKTVEKIRDFYNP